MNKEIFKQYGEYFLNKFKNNKYLKFDVVKNDNYSFGVYIYSNSDFSEYFLRIDDDMIYIDGIVVQDEALEFKDIEKIDTKIIYKFLDNQAEILESYLKYGINLYAYKNNVCVLKVSTYNGKKKTLFKEFDIKNFYKKYRTINTPLFEEITKIQLQDFYGNVVYEYNSEVLNK